MKTEEEWIKIYKECANLFSDGCNYVRLTLGQFGNDERWGFIQVICWNLEIAKKIIPFCEKHNLDLCFHKEYEIRLEEKQELLSSIDGLGGEEKGK